MKVAVTRAQESDFARDGFVTLGPALDPEELPELRARIDRQMLTASKGVIDLSRLSGEPPTGSLLWRVNLHHQDAVIAALARRQDFLDVVERVLGPHIQLFRDHVFYKPAGHGGEVYMHQDNRYWHLAPPDAVAIWIAIDESTLANGCVHFAPGSHRSGRVAHDLACEGRSVLFEAIWDKRVCVPIELPAGHATLHHCETIHWSPPNSTKRGRRGLSLVYMRAGVTQRGEAQTHLPLLRGQLPRSEADVR